MMCMALNYWHSGGDFADLDLIGRPSTSVHRSIFKRLKAILLSDVQFPATSMVRAGRRFPQLLARLGELSEFITFSGITSKPYTKDFEGIKVEKKPDLLPGLDPYRKADPSRIKISGRGDWDITELLPDELCMVYREPAVIFNNRVVPEGAFPHIGETPDEVASMARLWDSHGLLYIHNFNIPDTDPQRLVRIFGAMKDESRDRQIGDRRGMNYKEDKVAGPSAVLPNGSDLTDLMVDLKSQRIHIAVCDRKDFYHQIWCTKRRAITNSLGPGVPAELLEGTSALNTFLLQQAFRKKKLDRIVAGDHLHQGSGLLLPAFGDDRVCVSFKSILQGDHAGVEMACAAHAQLLKDAGLLPPSEELVANRPLESSVKAQGLVIDDYFSISVDPLGARRSGSSLDFATAKASYKRSNLLGSDDKDVIDSSHAKVIGAEINGGRWALQNGISTVSSPAVKRFSLSWVSLLIAALPVTTDHLHLSVLGGWTSTMTFRRPFMGLLSEAFELVKLDRYSPSSAKTVELPRKVAEELTLAAVLCPLMVADISTPLHDQVFATDASEKRGAVLCAEIDPVVNEALFKSFKTKGAYTRLQTQEEALAKRLEISEVTHDELDAYPSKVDRPLAFRFDFLELFSGASKITRCLGALGVVTGVPIELSFSEEFDLKWPHLLSWVFYLITHRLIKGLMVEPPCTTFSVMRRPPLRDRSFPFGFDVENPQTKDGNILAHRGLQLLWLCGYYYVAGLLETPNSSKLKFLPSWKAIETKDFAAATRVDSCQYGSQHLKSFKLLTVHLKITHAAKRCQGGHIHVPVEGAFTKASATYTDELAEAIAMDFLQAFRDEPRSVEDDIDTAGLEGFLPNEVMLSSSWRIKHDWAFLNESHINLLELRVVLRLVKSLVLEKTKSRVVSFIDSNVCRCALGKGRSSSRAISSILRRINTLLVCGGIWIVTPYMPTRLNAADDPTRLCPLREPLDSLGLSGLSRREIFSCARLPRTKRWASGWIRLTIALIGFGCTFYGEKTVYRRHRPLLDFDATLGFPGEGPPPSSFPDGLRSWTCSIPLSLPTYSDPSLRPPLPRFSKMPACCVCPLRWYLFQVLLFSFAAPGGAMDNFKPRNAADLLRCEQRQRAGPLPSGRLVLPRTAQLRTGHLHVFRNWCGDEGLDLDFLLENYRDCIDELNLILCRFGRKLYEVGRPRNHYFETINSLTALKPGLRRMVQQAWDLGFTWTKMEPSAHHVAAPFQVLMGMISLCILWGWPVVAGSLALMWGALLRPGEFLAATRSDLLLPKDVGDTISFAILSIREPKTRSVAARHQAARLDIPDLLQLVQSVFYRLHGHQRLWASSAQTLRSRFKSVLGGIGLDSSGYSSGKALDLGSMRAGGATWLLETTENGNLVQRRGRWISEKVMALYIQELTANIFMARLSEPVKNKILRLAHAFPHLSRKAAELQNANIPPGAWFRVFSYSGKE